MLKLVSCRGAGRVWFASWLGLNHWRTISDMQDLVLLRRDSWRADVTGIPNASKPILLLQITTVPPRRVNKNTVGWLILFSTRTNVNLSRSRPALAFRIRPYSEYNHGTGFYDQWVRQMIFTQWQLKLTLEVWTQTNTGRCWLKTPIIFALRSLTLMKKFTCTNMGGSIGNTGVEDVCLDLRPSKTIGKGDMF